MEELYRDHLHTITQNAKSLLTSEKFDVLLIHAGTPLFYHADDREIPFRTHAHFARFTPVTGPHHWLIIDREKELPLILEFRPNDFWEEHIDNAPSFWREHLPYSGMKSASEMRSMLTTHLQNKKIALVGDIQAESVLREWNIEFHVSETIIEHLNTGRLYKTPYEISCIEKATHIAARGHIQLKELFVTGTTERELYYAFLESTGVLPEEFPYEPIIALNEKSSTLHYRNKRNEQVQNSTLLVDAGVSMLGYASDITRTYVSESAHTIFTQIVHDLEKLQQSLCATVAPGIEFIELHNRAHEGIGNILMEHGILTCSAHEAIERNLTHAFFPHGLGHMLGLQVHDVGNANPANPEHPLTKKYPRLRTNRKLEVGMVTTIEPGVYFIPMLLNPLRVHEFSDSLNWTLIDELIPSGGVRIEDNLVITETGSENITRKYLLS